MERDLRASHQELLAIVIVIDSEVDLGTPCPLCSATPHREHCALVKALATAMRL